jgi:two-component system nitrogen regulation response regulator NtrX
MAFRILVIDDETGIREAIRMTLEYEGYKIDEARSGQEGLDKAARTPFDAILLDIKMPILDGIEVLENLREQKIMTPVVMVSGHGDVHTAVECTKRGAFDFLEKPLNRDKLLLTVRNAVRQRSLEEENSEFKEKAEKEYQLVGQSGVMADLKSQVERAAPTRATVLITGESGTGKELVAREIHRRSSRANKPFIQVNCAAIPNELIESELFGHEKGSFTGAVRKQTGKFVAADGGTIFLDEIGELDVAVQSKILRVIQERRFERIGGNVSIEADVRIICATNRNLEEAVKNGTFRDDLYFRINVFPVTVPPLRARREDIDALIDFFLQRFARELGRPGLRVTDEARVLLRGHDWPGNIRELQNYIERAAILCDRNTIEVHDVGLPSGSGSGEALREALDLTGTLEEATGRATRIIERMKIQDALQRAPNRNAAAELLGITTRALSMKLKELEIE